MIFHDYLANILENLWHWHNAALSVDPWSPGKLAAASPMAAERIAWALVWTRQVGGNARRAGPSSEHAKFSNAARLRSRLDPAVFNWISIYLLEAREIQLTFTEHLRFFRFSRHRVKTTNVYVNYAEIWQNVCTADRRRNFWNRRLK